MTKLFSLNPGDRVLIKTKKQLLEDGWVDDGYGCLKTIDWDDAIVEDMDRMLGQVIVITTVWEYNNTFEGGPDGGEEDNIYTWHFTAVNLIESMELTNIIKEIRKEIYDK